ncbi:MAG TPA: type II secretion system F family protein [Candidatus Saccharimonadales bacterium]|nr:type II secretion system F family protein [Candidatus Saccharimonadales bacterium]
MLTYTFTARDPATGQRVNSEVQAENEKAAAKAIKEQGYAPLEISLSDSESQLGSFLKRIKTKDKVIFSRQLSTLINAGLPLTQALRNVESQTSSKPFKIIIQKIIADVEAGSSFHESLARYPKVFNNVYCSLVEAGEASGTLDKALERLANQQEKDAEILSKVRGALVYPVLVIVVMIAVVTFMIVIVLPHVEDIYKGIPGAKLPLITQLLLDLSHFISGFWWLILIVLGLAIFFTTRWARAGPGKEIVDRAKMRVWPIGTLFMKLYMARFARTGETLVASGVPLLQVLNITGEAVDNVHIKQSLTAAAEKVKGGKALSDSLEKDPNFLSLVPNMIHIGEQSGSLETMLGKTADYYEKEVDNEIRAISTIIEPVLMIMLGVMALIIVAAVLLPIYGLSGKINVQ